MKVKAQDFGNRHENEGFTLIELLIVVAIIAILALIAVPNFLEAQVRAKVARVSNDLRTLAVANESYMVDHNTYPMPCAYLLQSGDPFRTLAYRALSTPVAYLTSGILVDPFMIRGAISGGLDRAKIAYEMGFSTPGQRAADLDNQLSGSGRMIQRDIFLLHSFGPDFTDDTSLADFGRLNAATGMPDATARIYDPTNGTISMGDIYRVQAPGNFHRYYTSVGSP